MSKKCSCGCCGADDGFQAPVKALDFLRAHAGAKPEVVAIAWEREDGHVFRYDVCLPKNIHSSVRPGVVHLVERCVKFVLWAAGGWGNANYMSHWSLARCVPELSSIPAYDA